MHLFAVCLNGGHIEPVYDGWWIELYWADDGDHAEEQALNANPESAIVCVAMVPDDYVLLPADLRKT